VDGAPRPAPHRGRCHFFPDVRVSLACRSLLERHGGNPFGIRSRCKGGLGLHSFPCGPGRNGDGHRHPVSRKPCRQIAAQCRIVERRPAIGRPASTKKTDLAFLPDGASRRSAVRGGHSPKATRTSPDDYKSCREKTELQPANDVPAMVMRPGRHDNPTRFVAPASRVGLFFGQCYVMNRHRPWARLASDHCQSRIILCQDNLARPSCRVFCCSTDNAPTILACVHVVCSLDFYFQATARKVVISY
jgi:hypothetical protein